LKILILESVPNPEPVIVKIELGPLVGDNDVIVGDNVESYVKLIAVVTKVLLPELNIELIFG
jgi:hypothetical protein